MVELSHAAHPASVLPLYGRRISEAPPGMGTCEGALRPRPLIALAPGAVQAGHHGAGRASDGWPPFRGHGCGCRAGGAVWGSLWGAADPELHGGQGAERHGASLHPSSRSTAACRRVTSRKNGSSWERTPFVNNAANRLFKRSVVSAVILWLCKSITLIGAWAGASLGHSSDTLS